MRQLTLGRTGLRVSEISLGTVELGLDYGIGVPGAPYRPPEAEASRLLNAALDMGVTCIDTARAYGTSESLIGQAIARRRDEFVLVSKTKTFHTEHAEPAERRAAMLASVRESLRHLRVERLDLLLLHSSSAAELSEPLYAGVLEECREKGWTRFTGASVYGCEAALQAIRSGRFDCLQVAWNALDRGVEAEVLPAAKECGVGLMVRSVLMRGALTGRRSHLPAALAPVAKAAGELEALALQTGMSLPELAFRYILSQEGPLTALVGTAWIEELAGAVQFAGSGPLPEEMMAAIRAIHVSDPSLLDLSRWPPV
ncbi:MAG: aldo/keto reductase [Bryobacterales bacterium]|nr:aldo/keto reductase [Bryobacterales bacterium]